MKTVGTQTIRAHRFLAFYLFCIILNTAWSRIVTPEDLYQFDDLFGKDNHIGDFTKTQQLSNKKIKAIDGHRYSAKTNLLLNLLAKRKLQQGFHIPGIF